MRSNLSLLGIIFLTIIVCSKEHEQTSLDILKGLDSYQEAYTNKSTKYSTKQLDNTNELSNSSVNTIFQDFENLSSPLEKMSWAGFGNTAAGAGAVKIVTDWLTPED